MKNSKTLIAIVIILIMLNCALLGFFWLKIYHKPQRPPVQGPAFEYLTKQLNLTAAQQQEYEKMRNAHRQLVDSLNQQSRTMRDSFFEKLKDTAAYKDEVNALGKRIAANTYQVDTSTFFHFQRFRKILMPTQRQKFDEIIQDVLRMGGGPPGANGPHVGPPQGMQQGRQMQPPAGGAPNRPRGRRPHQGQPPFGPPPDGGRGPGPGGPPPNGGPPPYGPPPGGPPPQK